MYPDRDEAHRLLAEAGRLNPGPWTEHSRLVAECARRIAEKCGMNADKAYVCGLMHDIGRRFGKRHLGHVIDGRRYMQRLGYDEAARVCLTHSFCLKDVSLYIGKADVTEAELREIEEALIRIEYDDYDRLIQLCDSLAGTTVTRMEDRMNDVRRRYGRYPEEKWRMNMQLKEYFEQRMGMGLYEAVSGEGAKNE